MAVDLLSADQAFICTACGIQFPPSAQPPASCPICTDERQYIPKGGQTWTQLAKMKQQGFKNCFKKYEAKLYAIGTFPKFAIGQRAFLIQSTEGNLLWDCISFLDEATVDFVKLLGGVRGIAISHPHYYTTCTQWSAAFGNVPIYLHQWDKEWVIWDYESVTYWTGEIFKLWRDFTLLHLGGHFAGAQVLHWASGANEKGALLAGDILQVGMDRSTVSIMRSYPNLIPLSASHAVRINKCLEPWTFDRLYGAFWDQEVEANAKQCVSGSLERYVKYLSLEDIHA
eukprot:c21416_g1_i1 orf=292-1143(-)